MKCLRKIEHSVVIYAFLQLVATGQGTITEITTEAEKILKEMGHTFNLKTVRMIGFFLAKLLRQLYLGCLVNHSGILKVK